MRRHFRHLLHQAGYDLTPHPLPDWFVFLTNLRRLLSRLEINCLFDVGAHEGGYASWLRHEGYGGWIFSFEPVADSFRKLEARMQPDPKWRGFQLALGAAAETRGIQVARHSVFTSFLSRSDFSKRTFGADSEVVREETVEVRQLETLFEECTSLVGDPKVFLKMDTQGFDVPVLEGAGRYLPDVIGLQSELPVQSIYEGATSYLEGLHRMTCMGFLAYAMVPVNRTSDGLVVEFDCLMARPGRG
jgi:FkbM family methyltransferase